MAFTESWVETDPDGSVITVSLLDDHARTTKRAVRERIEGDPAVLGSGLYESGTFGTTAMVKKGVARAFTVTNADLTTVYLQDGRLAVNLDDNTLYHSRGSGLVRMKVRSEDLIGGVPPAFTSLTVTPGTTSVQALTATTGTFSSTVATGILTPTADNTISLGSTANRWQYGQFGTAVGIGIAVVPTFGLHMRGTVATTPVRIRLDDASNTGNFWQHELTSGARSTTTITSATGAIGWDINPNPTDGAGTVDIRLFRSTTSTGTKSFIMFKGDGTNTTEHNFQVGATSFLYGNEPTTSTSTSFVVGGTSAQATFYVKRSNGVTGGSMMLESWHDSAAALFTFRRSRAGGTTLPATQTAIQTNDSIWQFEAAGWDGASYVTRGRFQAIAAENWAVGANGTTLRFSTTPNGSATLAVRWDIAAAGHLSAFTDNSVNIGVSAAANRPANGYFGTSVVVAGDPGGTEPIRATGGFRFTAASIITAGGFTVSAGTTAVQALTATTVTTTGLIQATLTTQQLLLRYDASNTLGITVASNGATTYSAAGAGAGHTFSQLITASNGITVAAGGLTVSSGTAAFQAITGTSLALTSTLQVGGGATVQKWLTATVAWDPASTAANTFASTTVTVTGAVVGDLALVSQAGTETNFEWFTYAYVSSADTVTLVWKNTSVAAIDPVSKTFRVWVVKF